MRRIPQIETADWLSVYGSDDPCEGERHLLLAVLERAIRDALGIRLGIEQRDKGDHRARAAKMWLGLEEPYKVPLNPEEFSFHWICHHLRINAEYVHNQLSRALISDEKKLKNRLYGRTLNRSFRRWEGFDKVKARKATG